MTDKTDIKTKSKVQCKIEPIDNKHNGLITKIWGGPMWVANHSATFGYPLEPTDEQKIKYKNYFISLGDILPCRFCRESYQQMISTGDTKLTDDVMKDRRSLTKWFWRVHNAVNTKLEIDYGVTYEDLVEKYESFRAKCGKPTPTEKGCVAPLDYKAFSFKKLYYIDAPIISIDQALPFIYLAKLRGLSDKWFLFLVLAKMLGWNFDLIKKQSSWIERNNFCQCQIKHMRENSINSIEESGKWKGTPTIDELKLLLVLSSNLNRSEISKARDILNNINM